MTKKRIKHELIRNESKRNTTLQKRTDGLLKKADELSVLCGVDVAVILHKRRQFGLSYSEDQDNNHDNAVLWPSSSMFRERLHRFLDLTNFEMRRRMISHEKYMEQRTNEEAQSSSKLKKRIELLESHQLMRQILLSESDTYYNNNLQELDLTELDRLNSVADEMLKKLEMKEYDDELSDDDQLHPPPPPPLPPRQEMGGGGGRGASSSSSASEFEAAGMVASTSSQPVLVPAADDELENMKNEQWFIHAMSEDQDQLSEPPQPPDAGGGAATSAGGINVPPPPDGESAPEFP